MLGQLWLPVTVLLFLVSLILRQVPIFMIAIAFFLAGGLARLWGRYCLNRVEYRRRLSNNRVFFGEEIQLEVEVSNRKPLPLPWLQVEDELPEQITLLKGKTYQSSRPAHQVLGNFFSLPWYHKTVRRYPVKCDQRGYFVFGPARIRSGDVFGFFDRDVEVPADDYLIVYPRVVPLESLGIPSRQPVGDILVKRHIHPDPLLTLGVRDYRPGDSLKRIHWKTSARTGQLQTKIAETTTTVDMGIFLDVRTVQPPLWGSEPELLELAVITATSIANHALEEGYRVGLYINQSKWDENHLIKLPPSQHADQFRFMLEALAQVHGTESVPIARFVQQESRGLPWGSSLVVITAVPTDALLSTLINIKRVGRRVILLTVGGQSLLGSDGLTTYHIPGDLPWRKIDSLSLGGISR